MSVYIKFVSCYIQHFRQRDHSTLEHERKIQSALRNNINKLLKTNTFGVVFGRLATCPLDQTFILLRLRLDDGQSLFSPLCGV